MSTYPLVQIRAYDEVACPFGNDGEVKANIRPSSMSLFRRRSDLTGRRDTISIALVPLAEWENESAELEFMKLLAFTINNRVGR